MAWTWFHRLGSPPHVYALAARLTPWFAWGAALSIAAGLYGGLVLAPPDYQQGEGFRIIYVHAPSAWMSLLVYTTMAVAAAVGLIWRIKVGHAVAASAAPIGASFTVAALVTGMLWGRPMWGTYWQWDPRLTSELLLLDYGALRQALQRRYKRIREGEIPAPDLLLIDGGSGQVSQVHEVLAELGFEDVTLIGVAKGPDRRPGQERLFVHGAGAPRTLEPHSPALRLIQRIRDEAHRFAISGHRRKRARRFNESVLETVPGLGPAKRRALLRHFGGLQGVMRAGVADLAQVAGIGTSLARSLYDHLHPGA